MRTTVTHPRTCVCDPCVLRRAHETSSPPPPTVYARRKSAAGYATKHARSAVEARDLGVCRICDAPVEPTHPDTGFHASVDHIVGWARGGTDDLDNLQLAHQACNSAKGSVDGTYKTRAIPERRGDVEVQVVADAWRRLTGSDGRACGMMPNPSTPFRCVRAAAHGGGHYYLGQTKLLAAYERRWAWGPPSTAREWLPPCGKRSPTGVTCTLAFTHSGACAAYVRVTFEGSSEHRADPPDWFQPMIAQLTQERDVRRENRCGFCSMTPSLDDCCPVCGGARALLDVPFDGGKK